MKKTTIFEDSGLKASEITGDIVKWLVYDGLEDKVVISHADDFVQLVLTTFVVGSIAAISGTMIKDFGRGVEKEIEKSKNKKIRESNQKKKLEKKKISITPKKVGSKVSTNFIPKEIDNNPFIRSVLTRYATAAIEGGVLFASYQITTKMVKSVVPENYNVKFVFNQVLQEIEREIDPDIV